MIFNYHHSMDREYYSGGTASTGNVKDITEKPLFSVKDVGQTVTEGRAAGGDFLQSVTAAIRRGASNIELSTQMEGAAGEEAVGAEAYGVEKRREIQEIANASDVTITSVHTPAQIGNLSGYAGPERGFSDEQRAQQLNEVKKAISFAADAASGGAVVVHTGEFQRPMSEQPWAYDEQGRPLFKAYAEEPERAVIRVVDDRTGHVIADVRKNQVVYRPKYKKADHDYVNENGVQVRKGDYLDIDGNPTDDPFRYVAEYDYEKSRFKTVKKLWKDFVQDAEEWNKRHHDKPVTPEKLFFDATLEMREAQSRGLALYYSEHYERDMKMRDKIKEALKFYEQLEESMSEEEKWKLMKKTEYGDLLTAEYKLPSEYLKENLKALDKSIAHMHETASSYEQMAEETRETRQHIKPIADYAKKQTIQSYKEAGIYAMQLSDEKKLKKDLFVAPEHIFPEMGYGAHPEELIEIVLDARKAMAEELVKRGYSESRAKKEAEDHIKATFDTQHLGMWRRYFQPREGETPEQTEKRFKEWYIEQVKKMEEAGIIGHIHIVDGFGYGHVHLPAGEGTMPVVDAVTYLKKKGYTGKMVSEGYAEGPDRILTQTWKAFGSPYLRGFQVGAPQRWQDIHQSYFGQTQTPYFTFGAYAPSNDWTLWSQVPME